MTLRTFMLLELNTLDRNEVGNHRARDCVLSIAAHTGQICDAFRKAGNQPVRENELVLSLASGIFFELGQLASQLDLTVTDIVWRKFHLNARKYPAELARGSTEKQSICPSAEAENDAANRGKSPLRTLGDVMDYADQFANERNWEQYHTPRNLILAMCGEVGELAECFQWKGDGSLSLTDDELTHIGEEISDVLIYLCRLCDTANI